MRVLVIGGTKFIGPYVVRELVNSGHDVVVFHRGESEASLPDAVRHVRSPLARMPVVQFPREVLEPGPDVVVHMIPMGEDDARAAVNAFRGRTGRMICLSSGDVYRAYGIFTGLEPGPPEPGLLAEDAPLRSVLFPYRAKATTESELAYCYEKILMERVALAAADLPATILRLPKVYGPGKLPESNADLATVYRARQHSEWRWTHGYVENVAHAIVLAALDPSAAGRIYNVGEEHTPTVGERLQLLPPRDVEAIAAPAFNYAQDIAYDTTRIRRELGFTEPVSYEEGIGRSIASTQSFPHPRSSNDL